MNGLLFSITKYIIHYSTIIQSRFYRTLSGSYFFSGVKPWYLFLYLSPVTRVELSGKAVWPPNNLSVSKINKKRFTMFVHRYFLSRSYLLCSTHQDGIYDIHR